MIDALLLLGATGLSYWFCRQEWKAEENERKFLKGGE